MMNARWCGWFVGAVVGMLNVAAACAWHAPQTGPLGAGMTKEQGAEHQDQPVPAQGATAGDDLSRADRFFEQGQIDAALALYTKVARAQDPALQGYARYKAAWCHVNLRGRESIAL